MQNRKRSSIMSAPLNHSIQVKSNPNPPGMETLSFAVEIPPAMIRRSPEDLMSGAGFPADIGVVGTITMFAKKSVMIWFGFGMLQPPTAEGAQEQKNSEIAGTGTFFASPCRCRLSLGQCSFSTCSWFTHYSPRRLSSYLSHSFYYM